MNCFYPFWIDRIILALKCINNLCVLGISGKYVFIQIQLSRCINHVKVAVSSRKIPSNKIRMAFQNFSQNFSPARSSYIFHIFFYFSFENSSRDCNRKSLVLVQPHLLSLRSTGWNLYTRSERFLNFSHAAVDVHMLNGAASNSADSRYRWSWRILSDIKILIEQNGARSTKRSLVSKNANAAMFIVTRDTCNTCEISCGNA